MHNINPIKKHVLFLLMIIAMISCGKQPQKQALDKLVEEEKSLLDDCYRKYELDAKTAKQFKAFWEKIKKDPDGLKVIGYYLDYYNTRLDLIAELKQADQSSDLAKKGEFVTKFNQKWKTWQSGYTDVIDIKDAKAYWFNQENLSLASDKKQGKDVIQDSDQLEQLYKDRKTIAENIKKQIELKTDNK